MHAPLTIVNPSERDWKEHRFVLSFGHSPIHLLVWGHLEDALEEAADWLCEHAPGLVHKKGNGADKRDPLLDELMAETCEELGLAWPIPDDIDWSDSDAMQPYWDAEQQAFADLTECEDCYIGSDEWCITLEDPTRAELKSFISELAERHYDDGPVVDITR